MYDADYDEKKKLAIGQVYQSEIRKLRNYKFLQKAMVLCHTAWNLLPEKTRQGFKSFDAFRDSITDASGYVDVYYDIKGQAYKTTPKSWAFDKMDEAEFSDLYERMKDVIWSILSKKRVISQELFEKYLAGF
jgi:hypothetical protein